MAFLDNSGDIILDAVLTDAGRNRLAKADGSFKIAKFAVGDDEVNYTLYQNANHPEATHPSGSAYFDLEILQTPILEAFTNNTSFLKSKLSTYTSIDLFYLPVILINDKQPETKRHSSLGNYCVAVDQTTADNFRSVQGVVDGYTPNATSYYPRADSGLDTTAISPEDTLDPDLRETQYILELDSRLASIVSYDASVAATLSFIDDDSIASYYFTETTDSAFVTQNPVTVVDTLTQVVRGPRGTYMRFGVRSSANLRTSDYLFKQIGSTTTMADGDGTTQNIRFIDTTIKLTGGTTGYRIDLPVRYIKQY